MPGERLPVYVPIAPLVVGALFVLIAVFRPAVLWDTGKVRLGREWFGEAGLAAFFAVIGLLLIAAGVAALLKRAT